MYAMYEYIILEIFFMRMVNVLFSFTTPAYSATIWTFEFSVPKFSYWHWAVYPSQSNQWLASSEMWRQFLYAHRTAFRARVRFSLTPADKCVYRYSNTAIDRWYESTQTPPSSNTTSQGKHYFYKLPYFSTVSQSNIRRLVKHYWNDLVSN